MLCDEELLRALSPTVDAGNLIAMVVKAGSSESKSIASRLEAIPIRSLGWRPSLLGWRPFLLGP